MINKGVFQINVDLKSLQIKIAITNFVFIKLLQNDISKCKKFKKQTESSDLFSVHRHDKSVNIIC